MKAPGIVSKLVLGSLLLWFLLGALAPFIVPYNPNEQNLDLRFARAFTPEHLLGTDSLGRDIFSRLLYGNRAAFQVGIGSITIAMVFGLILGLIGGLSHPRIRQIVSLFSDSILAVPTVLLSLTLIAAFGPGQNQVIVSLGVVFTPIIYRVVSGEVMKAKEEGWVQAGVVVGTGPIRLVMLHILPQIIPSLLIQGTSLFSLAISLEASLSFLGIGAQPPQASWGLMLQEARDYLFNAWNLALAPGISLGLTVLLLNIQGDIWAEKLKRQ